MAKQQVVFAERKMTSGDTINRSFTARLNGDYGHLFLTHQKLIFVEEKGFFSKTYNVTLDLPYTNIAKVHVEERNTNLTVTDTNGRTYDIAFDPASTVARYIKELKG
ncbi:MAG: PH domain-containing protein [Candidatus Bathyarchaeota archaeon]|nr:MAG: PH domain-containing protein [Candidatus Bathyarchaeota archaeon]